MKMWTISQLKERGNSAIRQNYWKSVLVALILSVIVAGGSGSAGSLSSAFSSLATGISNMTSRITDEFAPVSAVHHSKKHLHASADEIEDFEEFFEDYIPEDNYDFYWDDGDYDYDYDYEYEWDDDDFSFGDSFFDTGAMIAFFAVFFVVFMVIMLFVMAFAITLDVLILNPLQMGTYRFFYQNLTKKAEIKEVAYGFDRSYKNVISVMFFRDLYTFLWALLFIVPGIIKAYEYRMIPYIIAERPDMPREMVFATSKQMMDGNKWKAFVLDLSFIGWWILSAFTGGLLNIFYVDPYYRSTCAALYEALRYEKAAVIEGTAPVTAPAGTPSYDATPTEVVSESEAEDPAEDIFEED